MGGNWRERRHPTLGCFGAHPVRALFVRLWWLLSFPAAALLGAGSVEQLICRDRQGKQEAGKQEAGKQDRLTLWPTCKGKGILRIRDPVHGSPVRGRRLKGPSQLRRRRP